MPAQQTLDPEQPEPVVRQMSAAETRPMVKARKLRNCISKAIGRSARWIRRRYWKESVVDGIN
jgi:hypothetical protein